MRLARFTIIAAVLLAFTLAEAIAETNRPVWVCITRPALANAIKPLAGKRTKDGFDVRIISTDNPAEELSKLTSQIDYLLIVGDDQPGKADQPWYVPTKQVPAYRWDSRQASEYASDLAWADIDSDNRPDFPVGRIPARSNGEVRTVVQKILEYEALPPSMNLLDMPVGTGAGGFSPMIDRMTTALLIKSISSYGPKWSQPWIVSGDTTNALCGWPPEGPNAYRKQLANGPAIAALIGHSSENGFYFTPWKGKKLFFTADQAGKILKGPPSAPMIIVACLAAKFTGPEPCISEQLLFMPSGPVAMIGATRLSHPLPNYFTGISLLKESAAGHERLGDFWIASQQNMLTERNMLVEAVTYNRSSVDQFKLREDQFLTYAILGDPATRLKLPEKLRSKITREPGLVNWQVDKPQGATSLAVHFRPPPAKRPTLKPDANAETRRRLQIASNKIFAFKQVATLKPTESWSGTWDKPGTLRLTAIGPEKLHVAVFQLKPPAAKTQNSPAPEAARR